MKVPWTFPYLQHDKNTGPWNQKPGFWNRVCYQLYYLLSLGSSFLTDLRAYTFDTSASPFRPHLHPHLGGHTSLHCLKSCSVLGWNPKSSGSGPRLRLLLPLTPLPLAHFTLPHWPPLFPQSGQAPCWLLHLLFCLECSAPRSSVTGSFFVFRSQFKCHFLTLPSKAPFST